MSLKNSELKALSDAFGHFNFYLLHCFIIFLRFIELDFEFLLDVDIFIPIYILSSISVILAISARLRTISGELV